MLNHIWAFLVIVGILVAGAGVVRDLSVGETKVTKIINGKEVVETVRLEGFRERAKAVADAGEKVTKAAVNSVAFRYDDKASGKERSGAVGLAVELIGIMALWLGIMKIAEEAGLIALLARLMAPVFRILFPSIPKGHPAAGAMLMNMAANMLGLDNAATPLGIKAMQELQKLNGKKDTASNAMCMFLCINVSSITLLPASIIGYRVAKKSENIAQFMVPMLIATTIGTLSAIIMCKIVERFSKDTPPAQDGVAAAAEAAAPEVK